MADVIPDKDIEKLTELARQLINEAQHSPIEIIKNICLREKCSLAEAKEAYVLVKHNESLGQHQESVITPLLDEITE